MKKLKKELPKAQSVSMNFIMNIILKISALIFPLITFPYVSRVLGAAGNGKIAFVTATVGYFSMFAQLGVPTYGIKACASCRDNEEQLNKTVRELLTINTVTVLLAYTALLVSVCFVPRFAEEKALFIICGCSIILNAVGMEWLFQALEQYKYITIRNIFVKIISVLLMFLLVHKKQDYIIYGSISVLGTCGSNILNILYCRRFLDLKSVDSCNYKRHFKPLLTFFMLSIACSVYSSMDSVMLGVMCNDSEVGYYAAATRMKGILVSISTALGSVLLPRMSNYVATNRMNEFYTLIKKSIKFILIITIPITMYFCVMSDSTIMFLAGEGYANAILPMRIITLTVVLIGLSNITGMQILVPTNREMSTTKSTIIGAVVNLIFNALMIPRFGASGASCGTVLAEATVLFVQLFYLRQEWKNLFAGISLTKMTVALFLSAGCLLATKYFVVDYIPFLQLLITAVNFFAVYGIALLVMKEDIVVEQCRKLLAKIRH